MMMVRIFITIVKTPQIDMPPLSQSNGEWAWNPTDKVEVFVNFLEDVFKHINTTIEKEINQIIESD